MSASPYIPVVVIQYNNQVYFCDGGIYYGSLQQVPCPASNQVKYDGDFWAVPVVNFDLVSGFTFVPRSLNSTSPPTVQSFETFRLIEVNGDGANYWYVLGTSADWTASCAVCCSDAAIPMPTDLPILAPEQVMCILPVVNGVQGTKYFSVWGLPTLPGGAFGYVPVGYYNNVKLPAGTTGGYATTTELLAFLNGNAEWSAIGTWTVSSDNITLTVTQNSGTGYDILALIVLAENASGGSPF